MTHSVNLSLQWISTAASKTMIAEKYGLIFLLFGCEEIFNDFFHLNFFKINFFQNFFQEYNQSAKQFVSKTRTHILSGLIWVFFLFV